jgi:arginyl-tRNA synthetase
MPTISITPFGIFRSECRRLLEGSLKGLFPDISLSSFRLEIPPNPNFGELSSSMCFELAKLTGTKPLDLAENISARSDTTRPELVDSVKAASPGYVNFYVNLAKITALTMESAFSFDTKYGYVETENSKKIIVEHTSVNPLHPIHVGQARNPVLGDAISRLLKARGHQVFRLYYIDDVGRQTAVIAYGYEKLG